MDKTQTATNLAEERPLGDTGDGETRYPTVNRAFPTGPTTKTTTLTPSSKTMMMSSTRKTRRKTRTAGVN